jgi:hypothetical protein
MPDPPRWRRLVVDELPFTCAACQDTGMVQVRLSDGSWAPRACSACSPHDRPADHAALHGFVSYTNRPWWRLFRKTHWQRCWRCDYRERVLR